MSLQTTLDRAIQTLKAMAPLPLEHLDPSGSAGA
jgi:hypothetical protein